MAAFLGIDTSNYTTSVAVYDEIKGAILQKKRLLPVKHGEKGLRQNDAVFEHVKALPKLMEELFAEYEGEISAVGVSARPRDEDGSYMPCFLVGESAAKSVAAAGRVPVFEFSHQSGHIGAALFTTGSEWLLNETFIAFHVSGGTTEVLLVEPDENKIFKVKIIGGTLDLNAGQVIDRTGVMLGMRFPAGRELDEISQKSKRVFKIKTSVNNSWCNFSGVENLVKKMNENGESKEDICRFALEYVSETLEKMANDILKNYGGLPLIFSGGVMSNSTIKSRFTKKFGALFAPPEFSSDNAAGAAFLASKKFSK